MSDKDNLSITNFFDVFDDDILIQMILTNPSLLLRMCALVSLDLQLIKEGYYENTSNWGDMC
jgi:hypothetical protein